MTEISAGKLWGLRRLAGDNGIFKLVSADHRPAIKEFVAERRGAEEAAYEDVAAVKKALVDTLSSRGTATILDPHYGYPATIARLSPRSGLLLALEDSVYAETPEGRLSKEIDDWSVEKIKRLGADGVKVLTWYRPDAYENVLENQRAFTRRVGEACRRYDIPFVLELLVYSFPPGSDGAVNYAEEPGKGTEHLLQSIEEFAAPEYGVDLFMLQSALVPVLVPAPDGDEAAAAACQARFDEMGRRAGRPWIILSAGADRRSLPRILAYAFKAGASGYCAGRATWWDVFQAFPNMPAMINALDEETAPFLKELSAIADADAVPWTRHERFGAEGPVLEGGRERDFRAAYGDFGEDLRPGED